MGKSVSMSSSMITFDISEEKFGLKDQNLDKKWLELAKVNINEVESSRANILAEFKVLLNKDPKSEKFLTKNFLLDDNYLLIYLRAGEWDVTKAMEILSKFYSLGVDYKQYVQHSIPSKLDHVWSAQVNSVSNIRDKFGRRVVILKLGKWDPDLIPVEEWFASTFVMLEVLTKEVKTQIGGLTMLLDCEGFSFKHIRNLGVNEVRLASAFLNGSFPLWVRKIHFVNQPRIFGILMNVVKPFLSENAKDVLVFHGSDFTELKKEISPEILPKELGGSKELDNSDIVAAAKK